MVLAWRDTGHPEAGGSERYLHEICTRLAAGGHDVTYVTARAAGQARTEHRDRITFHRRGNRLTVYPLALTRLLASNRRVDLVIDVINGIPFGSPLVRRRGVLAVVHHMHREQWQMIYPDWRGGLGWWIESRLMPRVYRWVPFITVSEATRADLAQLGIRPDRICVVRNGIDTGSASSLGPRSPDPRLVTLGRLVPHKRVEDALEVVATLAREFPRLGLDVIGDGYWATTLRNRAADLGITDRVTFHGHVTAAERDAILRRAWLHLFPSVKEGWGLAVVEAGAAGVPSIAYATAGGVCESIDSERTGMLVMDLDGLIDGTRRVLADPVERDRLGARARAKALSRSWDSAAAEFEAALSREVTGRRRR